MMNKVNFSTIHRRIEHLKICISDYKFKLDKNYSNLYRDKLLKAEYELITLNRLLMCSITKNIK